MEKIKKKKELLNKNSPAEGRDKNKTKQRESSEETVESREWNKGLGHG